MFECPQQVNWCNFMVLLTWLFSKGTFPAKNPEKTSPREDFSIGHTIQDDFKIFCFSSNQLSPAVTLNFQDAPVRLACVAAAQN